MNKRQILGLAVIFIVVAIPVSSMAIVLDKPAHFGVSSLFGAAGESYFHYYVPDVGSAERVVLGTVSGSVPGLAKELFDGSVGKTGFSGKDMTANIAGAFAGSLISNFVNGKIRFGLEHNGTRTKVSIGLPF